jgi:hypothetical protein
MDPDLGGDIGPQFGTLILGVIWDPDLRPRFGTLIWDPDLGPRFGTPIWDTPIWDPNLDPDLGHPYLGPQFGTVI